MPAAAEDLHQLAHTMHEAAQVARPLGERAVAAGLTAILRRMEPYPPQPDRDRSRPPDGPSPYNTYVRGIGHFPRSSFAQVDGKWERKKKGAYKLGPKGGKVWRTSEQLRKKWRLTVDLQGDTVHGTLENEASYSGEVEGHKAGADAGDGIAMQAPYHALTGWPNVDDAIEQARPEFDQAVDEAIEAIAAYLKGIGS